MAAVDDKNQAVDLVAEKIILRPDQVDEIPFFMESGTISSRAEIRSKIVSSSNGSEQANSMT